MAAGAQRKSGAQARRRRANRSSLPPPALKQRPEAAALRPFLQGDLDGLCGVYAVINAARVLCPEIDREAAFELFQALVETLAKRRVGAEEALAFGLDVDTLGQLLRAARATLGEALGIPLRAKPLATPRKRPTLDQLWTALQESVGEDSTAIIGLSGLREHWTVGHRVTARRITLADSDAMRVLSRAHCDVKRDAAPYRLRAEEIVILQRVRPRARR